MTIEELYNDIMEVKNFNPHRDTDIIFELDGDQILLGLDLREAEIYPDITKEEWYKVNNQIKLDIEDWINETYPGQFKTEWEMDDEAPMVIYKN